MSAAERWLQGRTKRLMDIVLGVVLIVLTGPVLALAVVATRIRLGSPVLFQQQRSGYRGATLTVPKLRTMTDARGPDGQLLGDDERLKRFGKLLRSTSIDELPQLRLVVVGQMSLVGPRPLPVQYVARYTDEQRRRLDAKPGLTGWAQVQGRNALSWPDKLAMDVWYVDNASLRLDLRILALTVKAVFTARGIRAAGYTTMPEFTGES